MGNKMVNLALQGGGVHGAFTWGVLDRLLEEKDFQIEGITGASAGAVNGLCLVDGLIRSGNAGAREVLNDFWRKTSELCKYSLLQPTPLDKLVSRGNMNYNPFYIFFVHLTSLISPYLWNPWNYNPLRHLLADMIDFAAIQKNTRFKLFLSATNIRSSKVRILSNEEITVDAILASTCLPEMFQGVELNGDVYWDGGYIGNPAMFPLFKYTTCKDLILIQVQTTNYEKQPFLMDDIEYRSREIGFNSTLMREMRAIHFVNRLVDEGFNNDGSLSKINVHHIHSGELMSKFNKSSKYNVSWEWTTYLRDYGRTMADMWIMENYDKIGKESTCNWDCFM